MSEPTADQACQLCQRTGMPLTLHHLIPRTRHRNRRNKRDFSRDDVRSRTVGLCRPCHKTVHAVLTEKQLEREYNTLQALREHPEIRAFVLWVRRQAPGKQIRVRQTNDRRARRPRR